MICVGKEEAQPQRSVTNGWAIDASRHPFYDALQ
jgi:hypothetical protein